MADEIPSQNVIQIYRSPADGRWRAHIGPDDGRGVEQLGGTPCQALGRLISKIHGGQYAFDESWQPFQVEASYPVTVSLGDQHYECRPISAEEMARRRSELFQCCNLVTGGETGGTVPEPIDPVQMRCVG